MTQLKNAPVVYVLGVLRFPQLIDPQPFAAALQPKIRDVFPLQAEFVAPHFRVDIAQEGINFVHDEIKTWQFATLDRSWALMVNAGQIALHTNQYTGRESFIEKFAKCVAAAASIPDLGINLVQSFALRYVDLIVPRENEHVEDYLEPGFLPTDIKAAGLSVEEGVYAAGYTTDIGSMRVQSFRRPPSVLPLELISEFTQRDGWAPVRPLGDFAVLDVDHGVVFDTPVEVDAFDVHERMLALHGPIRGVFDALMTPHAMKVWSGGE